MATGEQYRSRDREWIGGLDGIIRTETRFYDVDDADTDTWEPPEGRSLKIAGRRYYLVRAKVNRHTKGTKATAEAVFSDHGIEDDASKTYFFRSAGTQERRMKNCQANQHPNVISVPSAQGIIGYTTWLKSAPVGDVPDVGKVNVNPITIDALGLTVGERTLLMLFPDAEEVGEERWRVTRQWMWNPEAWEGICQVDVVHAGGDNRDVYFYIGRNMDRYFT